MLTSTVPGFEGPCKPVWVSSYRSEYLNEDAVGFFKRVEKRWWWPLPVKVGPEFYAVMKGETVYEDRGAGIGPEFIAL